MNRPVGEHQEIQVGGELDEARLRAIASRALLLRNLCVPEAEALEYATDDDGETPCIVDYADGGETSYGRTELHVGCGDYCPVLIAVPWDPDMGGIPRENAVAVAHAGRDMLDLVREVISLRELLNRSSEGR